MENELPQDDWLDQVSYILGWREIFLVEGDSMSPTLENGDVILIDLSAAPEVGDIVLAQHPYNPDGRIIKRLLEVTADGKYFLLGDNPPESTDSRHFGPVPAEDILGKVICRLNEDKNQQR